MQYKAGLFGGSFDPLHVGHVNCIIEAASECEDLYVVLCFSRIRDSIPMEIRYRWLVGCFRHMPNIHILLLEDSATSKEEYDTNEYWESGRNYILRTIETPIDVVYCGSDYLASKRYESLYGCEVKYFMRSTIPVSSSEIRKNPLAHWDELPTICRPYFAKKVLFVGSESTGKSTIVQNLAMVYGTNFLKEVGREVCWNAGCENTMVEEDFHETLIRHKAEELACLKESNRILFVDTDALTTLWFSQFLLKDQASTERVSALATAIQHINRFDLIFFMEPSVAFIQDGTRNELIALNRDKYSAEIKHILNTHQVQYISLSGSYADRFREAKRIINETFDILEVQQ